MQEPDLRPEGRHGAGVRRAALQCIRFAPVVSLCACSGEQSSVNPQSPDAEAVAALWWGMLIVGVAIFSLVIVLLGVGIWRSLRATRPRHLSRVNAWTLVVCGGIALPAITIVAMVAASLSIGRDMVGGSREADVDVEVVGRQWWWEVRYLDPRGEVIATTANEIHIPVDRRVRLSLTSADVIHSFWVPNLQGKTDLIPGTTNETWLRTPSAGTYRGQCAEFCGTQHAFMAFIVVAQPADEFQGWLDRQERPAAPPEDETRARGLQAFLDAGCGKCHAIRGTLADGRKGPDLTHLAGRRTLAAATIPNGRGQLAGWIADPQHIKPGNAMPPGNVPAESMHVLLDYLEGLK